MQNGMEQISRVQGAKPTDEVSLHEPRRAPSAFPTNDVASVNAVQPEDTAVLSVGHVCEKLRQAGLDRYCEAFQESAIDGSMLDELHELWDQPLGVTNKAHQIKILKLFGKR